MKFIRLLFLTVACCLAVVPALGQVTISPVPLGIRDNAPYSYYRVTTNNATGQPLAYTIIIRSEYSDKRSIRLEGQTIPAGAERIYNLALPMSRNATFLVEDSGGGRTHGSQNRGERHFLQIDDVANWASEKEMLDFSAVYLAPHTSPSVPQPGIGGQPQQPDPSQMTPEQAQAMMQMMGQPGMPGMAPTMPSPPVGGISTSTLPASPTMSTMPPTPPSMPPGRRWRRGFPGGFVPPVAGVASNLVSQLEPVSLPDNWLCYTPFRAVFIWEPAFDRMGPTEKDALMKWVQSGGDLTVYASEKETITPVMLGRIRYQRENPLKTKQIAMEWRSGGGYAWERYFMSENFGDPANEFIYDSKERGGRLGGLILASAFFILAGPVNYIYFKRKKEIRRILITTPLISVGFCIIIIIYFIAAQGFAKRGGSFAITVLDETSDAAFTFARHSFFSGLYPLGGFSFDRETAFYPMQRNYDPNEFNYSMNLTKSQDLESGLFSPSFNFHYFTAMPSKTRERIVFDRRNKTITNGFEKPLDGILIYENSAIWAAGSVSPGAKAQLRAMKNPEEQEQHLRQFLSKEEQEFLGQMESFYQPILQSQGIRYFARLSGGSASLQSGVAMRSAKICNLLVGRLEEKK